MKTAFLDKLMERLDRLDPGSVQSHFLHLAREKGLLETVFHALQEGITVLDERGRILYANRAAEKLLGLAGEDAVGSPMSRYLREIEWRELLGGGEQEGSRLVSREVEISYPEHRFLAFYIMPLAAGEAAGGGSVVIFRDVTRDREHEARSIASERLRAIMLLAAGVAHEIGNPLNSLTIHLQLLQREVQALPAGQREAIGSLVDVAGREVTRLDHIINQFLHAVRPVTPRLESAPLVPLLEETVRFLAHEIADRGVRVEWERPDALPGVKVDVNQVRQVFFNLVKNAVEAMPQGGVLRIALRAVDRFLAVTFADSGEGIDPGQMSRVFDPYFTTKAGGTGLGMLIVQRIVRDHGGEIEIQSHPGEGTAVTVFLPREDRLVRLLRAPRRGRRGAGPAREEAP